MRLDDTLSALGPDGSTGHRVADVPVAQVVGTLDRPYDFDQEFRLVNRHLRERWQRLADAMASGTEPPPVDLVQLGDLYFVADGHHRVSVARELGRRMVTARVRWMGTIAFGMACLRAIHLASKQAEREFLNRVPLPDRVREDLWLDTPADWMRLMDAARSWGLERALAGRAPADPTDLAAAWWHEEVTPVLGRLRAAGFGHQVRDVELYATALAARDRLGIPRWPSELTDSELTDSDLASSDLAGSDLADRPTRRGGVPSRR